MASLLPALTVVAESSQWLRAASVAGITAVVLFVILLTIGFTVLFRRRGSGGLGESLRSLGTRANILLVRVDDAIASSEEELGFAIAQFGEERTREFSRALAGAKSQLIEAFALRQHLDDAMPDTETQRREWTARIVQLCKGAQTDLAAQRAGFDELRQLEQHAPQNLADVRELIARVNGRVPATAATLVRFGGTWLPTAFATVAGTVSQADGLLREAAKAADEASSALTSGSVGPVAPTIQTALGNARRAGALLDAIERRASSLDEAAALLTKLVSTARADLEEARRLRDAPPDADTDASVTEAMARLERVLAGFEVASGPSDPVADSVKLQHAVDELDTALAGARNQKQRLEHAAAALVGALVIARSQLATTRDLIGSDRGRIGAEARTRLAEAERQVMLAEAESDPVAALDTARRSATFSRDADALAHYDLMGAVARG